MHYALVNESGLVVNVIEWDGETEWCAPDGLEAIPDDTGLVAQGDQWNGVSFQEAQA
ncbi:MAG: hypothetical protein ABR586_01310 [Thermoplasmatota archaeon]